MTSQTGPQDAGKVIGVGGTVALALMALMLLCAPAARAACPAPAGSNAIVVENCRTDGVTPPSTWDIPGAGDDSIQGFASDISVNRGTTVSFKVDTPATAYRLDIYRMGWYGGNGARRVATIHHAGAENQPPCDVDATTTGLVDCGDWTVSDAWNVPADATSGIYFAHLVREDGTPGESHVVFIVRDDASRSSLLFQTSDTTWQAYNDFGGHSLYSGGPGQNPSRAYKVSYNRPFRTRAVDGGEDWVFNAEYPMVRFLERNGYDVSYFTGVDSDRFGGLIQQHRTFLSVGHDEYWSGAQRANVTAARDAGVNLGFFSGNEIFWKTRWENDHRTLVSYKETHANAKIDPVASTWTGSWRDPRPFNPEGGHPENALSGTIFMVNSGTAPMEVPAADGKMRFWRGTSIATLPAGATATLADGTVGYEWDEDLDNGARPPGLIRLSTTQVNGVELLQDYGSTYLGGQTATHHLTLYRAPSGALVFGAGTVQWPWGLDDQHDRGSAPADSRMQQATVNLFADMGVQPGSLQAGLTPAAASTDTVAPTSTILSPAPGSLLIAGQTVTVTGTATDAGGGVVGGVEVSLDGGVTWHPATGRATWTYTGKATVTGTGLIRSRATDDSGNLEGRTAPPNPGPGPGPGPSPGPTPPASGGGGGGVVATPVDRKAPRVRVSPRRVRASRSGVVKLRVACPRGERSCRTQLRLRLHRRYVASKTLTIRGGRSRVFALKLNRAARRELTRKRSLKVTAVAVARDAARNRATTKTTIRLLAAKGHR
jgi:N,N-dimethylformamidase beta subunit-like, C-terminal/Bacterial Ig domain